MKSKYPSFEEIKADRERYYEAREIFINWFQDQKGEPENEFRVKKASVIMKECWEELYDRIKDAIDIEETNRHLMRN